MLIDQDRLAGYLNFAYRGLKNHRDGCPLEARLDAGESVSWLLQVMFTLAGRLRPYNKYLPWELRTHPLGVPEWSAEVFLPELERMPADAGAIRRTFAVVHARLAPGMPPITSPYAGTSWTPGETSSPSCTPSSTGSMVQRCRRRPKAAKSTVVAPALGPRLRR